MNEISKIWALFLKIYNFLDPKTPYKRSQDPIWYKLKK
jgi:hypothetical protein